MRRIGDAHNGPSVATLCVAVLFLNAALSFHNVWPTVWVKPGTGISLELAVILLLLAARLEWFGSVGRGFRRLLTGLLLLLVLGRYLQVSAPALFGRSLNLYWDAPHIPAVTAMLAAALSAWQIAATAVSLLIFLTLLIALLAWAVRTLFRGMAISGQRRVTALVAALAICLCAAGKLSDGLSSEYWFSVPVAKTFARQLQFVYAARFGGSDLLPAPLPVNSDLNRLQGGDLHLIFLESYGAVALKRPEFAAALAPSYARLAELGAAAGWLTASAWVESTTFGGGSWLAHASLMSGTRIADQQSYNLLLASSRDNLSRRFKASGYRTVALMPALRKAWPEGSFYDFDAIYDAGELDYRGPAFGWWVIPDQHTLEAVYRRELSAPQRAPLLVFYPTVMSHAPFKPTPPYQPVWDEVTTSTAFTNQSLPLAEYGPVDTNAAYLKAIGYNLDVLGGYLSKRAPANALLIVLGDHQPPAYISGQGASRDVPVHVFSQDESLWRQFLNAGFDSGLTPQNSLGGIEKLHGLLLRVLDSGANEPRMDALNKEGPSNT